MFPSNYEEFIYKSRYARWLEGEGRREDYPETVERFLSFMLEHLKQKHDYDIPAAVLQDTREALLAFDALPSMRALMTAGPALMRNNMAAFNCSYEAISEMAAFWEAMGILLNGTGVGYSAERKFTDLLPEVPSELLNHGAVIMVEDSKEGWVEAYKTLLKRLYRGEVSGWDTSAVRPKGARLKTFGGRASGPEPLQKLFDFTIDMFYGAVGRKLEPIECHDLMCMIADIVVVGGVRRSAMISLSDLNDPFLANAKGFFDVLAHQELGNGRHRFKVQYTAVSERWFEGNLDQYGFDEFQRSGKIGWWVIFPHRALANNSAVYEEKPDAETFIREWGTMVASKAGERGFFNRAAAEKQVLKTGRRKGGFAWGTNPCSEIILRNMGVCNLSEVVVRATDTLEELKRKVEIATIFGTWQSTLTNFPGMREDWIKNAEEERLLGVSMTGAMDHPVLSTTEGDEWREILRDHAVAVNKALAAQIGIAQAAAVTCIKPSGTTSQLTNTASGLHVRHSDFYIRTVRGDKKDPLSQFLIDAGVPAEDCVMRPDTTVVFSFPIKSPDGALTRADVNALDQLESWKRFQDHWCEHKPSCTVSVKDEEWVDVASWVFKNFDDLSGISFLPHTDHVYQQAPYQEITEEEYNEWLKRMPEKIYWQVLASYETEDHTSGSQTLACSSGACELVDINA